MEKANTLVVIKEVLEKLSNQNTLLKDLEKRLNNLEKINNVNNCSSEKENDKKINKNIEECLNLINWKRIHDVMETYNWQWYVSDDYYAVPSANHIRSAAKKLLKECYDYIKEHTDEEFYSLSSGGLNVKVWNDYSCKVAFELEYGLAES